MWSFVYFFTDDRLVWYLCGEETEIMKYEVICENKTQVSFSKKMYSKISFSSFKTKATKPDNKV